MNPLVAESLRAGPEVAAARSALLAALERHTAAIVGVRSPDVVISSTAVHDATRGRFPAPVRATEDRHVADLVRIVDAAPAAA